MGEAAPPSDLTATGLFIVDKEGHRRAAIGAYGTNENATAMMMFGRDEKPQVALLSSDGQASLFLIGGPAIAHLNASDGLGAVLGTTDEKGRPAQIVGAPKAVAAAKASKPQMPAP